MEKKFDYAEFRKKCELFMREDFKESEIMLPVALFQGNKGESWHLKFPPGVISTVEGKDQLASYIKKICQDTDIQAMSFIIEVDIIDPQDRNKKCDGLMWVCSTPEFEEMCSYKVDYKNHEVLELAFHGINEQVGGQFSNFFARSLS